MQPRAGGEAEKFGNRYEGIWTVRQLLEILYGRAGSITVERTGEEGKGVEFLLTRAGRPTEAHQVKRQRAGAAAWSLRALRDEGVLSAAADHVEAGREFHFVSMLPATALAALSDRARRSEDLRHFLDGQLTRRLRRDFDFLSSEIWETPERAWRLLQGIHCRVADETELRSTNAALAGVLLEGGAPGLAALGLGDLIVDNLAVALDAEKIKARVANYELRFAPLATRAGVADRIDSLSSAWRSETSAEMLNPPIERSEALQIAAELEGEERIMLASGTAGGGKTGVLNQVLARLAQAGWPVLAVRLDRRESFATALELGEQLGLGASPVAALAAVSGEQPALLLLDQLDAVSLASGRMPESFGAIAVLLREAAAFPQLRVLLAARQFDIDNDNRLRGLVSEQGPASQFKVELLSEEQVEAALTGIGVDAATLAPKQREILRLPLHLLLFAAVATEVGALTFSTQKDLFDLFWTTKARAVDERRPGTRFTEAIDAVLDEISTQQRLSVPAAALDDANLATDADVLASEHVLVKDSDEVAFFHEAFFDYAFARRWIRRGEILSGFLLTGEQELFRRAQVRGVLSYLRDFDRERFLREVADLLAHEEIRYHLKDVVLALLRTLPDPTRAEWQMLDRLLKQEVDFEERIWATLRSVGWFDRLAEEGKVAEWLANEDLPLRGRAVDIMVSAVGERVEQVAELLNALPRDAQFPNVLLWVARFAPVERSRLFFEMLLKLTRSGDLDGSEDGLWQDVHGLGESQPSWAVELLVAFLQERPAALAQGIDGKIIDLGARGHGLTELVGAAAAGAPRSFAEGLLTYMLAAMGATSSDGEAPLRDDHFSFRIWRADIHDLDDALLYGMRDALTAFAEEEPERARPLLEQLEVDPHDAAQWLLYEGLRAGAADYADWAARILLQGEHRFRSGYLDSSLWTTRQLLEAIGPHVSDELFIAVEAAVLDLKPAWESKASAGLAVFTLLSALPEARLSSRGRRRLGELRRRFDREQPFEPVGIQVGAVRSPIPQAAAEHMSDDQWLKAIAKYASGERWDRLELRGDAEELAQVLEAETKLDAERFAKLALAFDTETHPAYTNAVLRAVGDREAAVDSATLFALVRHADQLGRPENDPYLGDALASHADADVPADVIEILLARALSQAESGEEEGWLKEDARGNPSYGGDPWSFGMNTPRGRAAERLADLVSRDADGKRSALVAPHLAQLAQDPSVGVRASVARLLIASLRYQRDEAISAFERLVQCDDRLLASDPVERLAAYIGSGDPKLIEPLVERMLASVHDVVREAGGRLAAFAGLELGLEPLLVQALSSSESAIRKGAATVCAARLPYTSDVDAATETLSSLFEDDDEEVRAAAADVAAQLRDRDLRPHLGLLTKLVSSRTFPDALTQLLFTLEGTTSPVAELALECAERFLATHREEMSDISTRAAGDARHVGELLLRTYAQASDAELRARALDAVDELLLAQAQGINELLDDAER
jgi:hypothetical protein